MKWLKFGSKQANFLKMFGPTKFQLSITCTFRVIKLLMQHFRYFHWNLVFQNILKTCLKTKVQLLIFWEIIKISVSNLTVLVVQLDIPSTLKATKYNCSYQHKRKDRLKSHSCIPMWCSISMPETLPRQISDLDWLLWFPPWYFVAECPAYEELSHTFCHFLYRWYQCT